MKKLSPKNIAWYVADKATPYITTLMGIGAAKAIDEGVLETIVSAGKFPYDLLIGGSFAAETGKAFLQVGANIIDHPTETIATMIGAYAIGKVASYMNETKRLKQVYGSKKK